MCATALARGSGTSKVFGVQQSGGNLMKTVLASLALATAVAVAFVPEGQAAPAGNAAKMKSCKAQAVARVKSEMGAAAQKNKAAAKAKGMGYYKQCMAG